MNAPLSHVQLQQAVPTEHIRARPLLGTLVEIAASGRASEPVLAAIADAFSAVTQVHALMSYHEAESDISRINRLGFAQTVRVHAHTWLVLKIAREIAEASDGLFDISIAPTLTRLGFLPPRREFPRASGQGDWRHVALLPRNRVRLTRRLRVDLSGIAKGYAVDLAINALQRAGMSAGRVNAGGDMRMFGATTQIIHVRVPRSPTHVIPLLTLAQGAAATSAGYFSKRRHAGRMVTPLIHPITRTACGIERSITVLAHECVYADALTKVVHADPARAAQVLSHFNARALMVEQDSASGGCRVYDSALGVPTNERARWNVEIRHE